MKVVKLLPKVLIVLLLVPILSVPVVAVVAFFLTPLWSWIELTYQIESIGHSGPAEWCFVAVYLGLVTFSLGSLALLALTRPRKEQLEKER